MIFLFSITCSLSLSFVGFVQEYRCEEFAVTITSKGFICWCVSGAVRLITFCLVRLISWSHAGGRKLIIFFSVFSCGAFVYYFMVWWAVI